MSDELNDPPADEQIHDGLPADGGADDADDLMTALEVGAQVDPKSGQKMVTVPLGTLVNLRKGTRESAKRIKELEPIAARTQEVESRLSEASPLINALLNNPKLRAEALRGVHGGQAQDAAEAVDEDAREHAEDHGWYMADGVTPDTARAARDLARIERRSGRQVNAAVQPFAGLALNQQAETNMRQALAMTDNEGVPLATAESIKEVAKMLPAHLLANPQVVELVVNNAIGIDRRNGRTPKAPDEPLYMASQNGRRAGAGVVVTAEERAFMKRNGISEKDYLRSTGNLAAGVSGRRGIALGGDE
jgi:hypothetical protein